MRTASLTEGAIHNHAFTTPILRIYPVTHITMKCRKRPLSHPANELVFHRVPVQVVQASVHVGLVTHAVFPEAPLPDTTLAPSHA